MKHVLVWILLALIALMACQDETLLADGAEAGKLEMKYGDLKFSSAIVNDVPDTRVVVCSDSLGVYTEWQKDDKVMISSSKVPKSKFGALPDKLDKQHAFLNIVSSEEEPVGAPFTAFYPYAYASKMDTTVVDGNPYVSMGFTFPFADAKSYAEQWEPYTNICRDMFPMAAMSKVLASKDVDFRFRNLASVIKLRVYCTQGENMRISKVVLSADQPLCGDYKVFFNGDGSVAGVGLWHDPANGNALVKNSGRTLTVKTRDFDSSRKYTLIGKTDSTAAELNIVVLPYTHVYDEQTGVWTACTDSCFTNLTITVSFQSGYSAVKKVCRYLPMVRNCYQPITINLDEELTKIESNMGSQGFFGRTGSDNNYGAQTLRFVTDTTFSTNGLVNVSGSHVSKAYTSKGTNPVVMIPTSKAVYVPTKLGFGCFKSIQHFYNLAAVDFRNVTSMAGAFTSHQLCEFDFRGLNLPNLKDMNNCFYPENGSYLLTRYGCKALEWVAMDSLKLPSLTTMNNFCRNCCTSLNHVTMKSLYAPSLTSMVRSFADCTQLEYFDMKGMVLGNGVDMTSTFQNCKAMKYVYLDNSHIVPSKAVNLFRGCLVLEKLPLNRFDFSLCTDMSYMVSGCKALASLDVRNINAASCTTMAYMLSDCVALTSLDFRGFNAGVCTDMQYMFSGCSALTKLDFSGANVSSCKNMRYMFNNCTSLKSLDLRGINTAACTDMQYMFSNCKALEHLYLDEGFIIPSKCGSMFNNIGASAENGCTIHCPKALMEAVVKNKVIKNGKVVWDVY